MHLTVALNAIFVMDSVYQYMQLPFFLAVLTMKLQQGYYCPYAANQFLVLLYVSWLGKVARMLTLFVMVLPEQLVQYVSPNPQ